MPRKRPQRNPYILWGEGPTEQLFLELFKQYYCKELSNKQLTLGNGGGGSPGSILEALDRKALSLGASQTPTLVLLDEDKGLDRNAKAVLEKYTIEGKCSITVIYSKPQCLEGMLLDILGNLPPKSQHTSERLKKRFLEQHLGGCDHIRKKFKSNRKELFPKTLLNEKMGSHPILAEIKLFLDLIIE